MVGDPLVFLKGPLETSRATRAVTFRERFLRSGPEQLRESLKTFFEASNLQQRIRGFRAWGFRPIADSRGQDSTHRRGCEYPEH